MKQGATPRLISKSIFAIVLLREIARFDNSVDLDLFSSSNSVKPPEKDNTTSNKYI